MGRIETNIRLIRKSEGDIEQIMADNLDAHGIAMQKDTIRRRILAELHLVSEEERQARSETIQQRILDMPEWRRAETIMIYMHMPHEVGTDRLIEELRKDGRSFVVPQCMGNEIVPCLIRDPEAELKVTAWGVREPWGGSLSVVKPGELDFVLVPGVAFDRQGNRLGYGRGYYDRFLKKVSEDAGEGVRIVGVCFEKQVVETCPVGEGDYRVARVVTEGLEKGTVIDITYYAHTKEDAVTKEVLPKSEWQLLQDHLKAVASYAEQRAAKFGAGKIGYLLGLAHDLGKYSINFQKRLKGSSERVDHASAGAQEVFRAYGMLGKAMAYALAGHHGGLPDGHKGDPTNLSDRLLKEIPPYTDFRKEIELPVIVSEDLATLPQGKTIDMDTYSKSFFIRMLFSCLVDADYLDTESFMQIDKFQARPQSIPLHTLWERFCKIIDHLEQKGLDDPTPINQARQEILKQSMQSAENKPGFFTLTVPTGGGKTYSSLAFALKHALAHAKTHKMERIIYVIPYTSIIEQNAQVFREALETDDGCGVVLEHHSNYEYPETPFDQWNSKEKAHRLGTENWNMPVVVTTAVQFFESLHSNKGTRCRKLHNMANSVIILDEAQMMPIEYLKPCLWALSELVLNYGSTVVLCTATQPAIGKLLPLPKDTHVTEIMDNPDELQKVFKRVEVNYVGEKTDVDIAEIMSREKQMLTIINTRRHACLLFDELSKRVQTGIYHLSARMCPIHRNEILEEIHSALKNKKECRVVSTQLIECGIDVDFPTVGRSEAGLDSIAQAAGRCNREGELQDSEGNKIPGQVLIFKPEKHGRPRQFDYVAGIMRDSVLLRAKSFPEGILSHEAIEAYFQMLYHQENDKLDAHHILSLVNEGAFELSFPFAEIRKEFQIIDSPMVSVVVPYDERGEKMMNDARKSNYPLTKSRLFQPYTVQIYTFELDALMRAYAVERIGDSDIYFLRSKRDFYDDQFGLKDAEGIKAPSKDVYVY